ncbi:MAG: hypothetical protein JXA22_00745 [Candidatus Thermoplasmatota archaeon]|nr:hypothetical protein [Candidatus Thermoplasmatota archaeon]
MFDRKDIENLGAEYERGLRQSSPQFTDDQIIALRVALEMSLVNAFRMIEGRVELKGTQKI